MTDPTPLQTNSQDPLPKAKNNKRILVLLIGLLFVFILAITYIRGKQQELLQPVPQPTPTLASPRVEDQIIIKFKQGVSEKIINETLKKYNAAIIKRIDAIQRVVIQVPKGQEDAILKEMKKDNLIEEAEPDYINEATFVPNDPSLNVQWGLENTGQTIKGQAGTPDADINAVAAWDVTKGNGVKIAILDTGINLNHPEFLQKILTTKDFIGTGIEDQYGHGTHVAGIAAARTNNSIGISGTCPDCMLIIGKVLNDQGSGPDSILLQGITWAADEGAKVINMSFGGTGNSTAKQDAINYAWNKGAVLVASAGNNKNTNKGYPAANNNVVSVAATDNKDQKASFSSYGTWVDVAAPGNAIYSTLPTHSYNLQTKTPSLQLNYDYLNGTSMATPMVSGVVALIWTTGYGSSNISVVNRLFETADKISGTGTYWINGRVNAALAVSGGVSSTPAPTTIIQPTNTPTPMLTATPTPIPSVSTPTPTPAHKTPPCGSLGDLNNDGFITTDDENILKKMSIGEITPTDRSDLNGNGQLADAGDLVLMKRFLLGEITTFPRCSTVPTLTPTPVYVTPTIYCLGSCPTLPITPTTTLTPSNQPSPSQSLSPFPSVSVIPTIEIPTTTIIVPNPTQNPTPRDGRDIFQFIWDLIRRIIEMIMRLLGSIIPRF